MIPKIIFDTDMDTDCDDVGALALILQYCKANKAELAGIICDAPCIGGGPVCEALCHYYGYDIPIGVIYEKQFAYNETTRYHKYRNHRHSMNQKLFYNKLIAKKINKCDEDYPDAVSTYRRILAACEDHSVVIAAVGFMTAIEQLWLSKADQFSELDGYTLFSQKVKAVVSMGCADYPETDNYNFNYNMDGYGAQVFFDRCPCPIYVSPDGENVITGSSFSNQLEAGHPMRFAYEIYNGTSMGRMSWDLLTCLFILENGKYFNIETHGMVQYLSDINHVKWINGKRTDYQIKLAIDDEEAGLLLENILINGTKL